MTAIRAITRVKDADDALADVLKAAADSPYTALADQLVRVDTSAGAVTVKLPNAPEDHTRNVVKHVTQGGTNAVTVQCQGSDVINKAGGVTSFALPLLGQGVDLVYDRTNGLWIVVSDDLPLSGLDTRFGNLGRVQSGLGQYLKGGANGGSGASWARAVNQLTAYPWIVANQIAVTSLTVRCLTGVTSAAVRLGLYTDSGFGQPKSLIIDGGTVDCSTTGVKELAITSTTLAPGLYWKVAVQQGGAGLCSLNTATLEMFDLIPQIADGAAFGLSSFLGFQHGGYLMDSVTGALPATFVPKNSDLSQTCALVVPKVS